MLDRFTGYFTSSLVFVSDRVMLALSHYFPTLKEPQAEEAQPVVEPPIQTGFVPPQFICWHCNEHSLVPEGHYYTGVHVFSCAYCQIDNQVHVDPFNNDEHIHLGCMASTNRCANYF